MKRLLLVCLASVLLAGCIGPLKPKKVEYFQRTVKPVPVLPPKAEEHQRQAAEFVAVKTEQVEKAAIQENASTNILVPAAEAHGAAQALSESLGPAEKPWTKPASNLVEVLHKDQAEHNAEVRDYADNVQRDVGKKIEDTGLVKVGYFTNLFFIVGGLVLLIALAWTALKIYGMVNPIVGAGTSVIGLGVNAVGRIAGSVVSRGFSEVVAGGERFKTYLETSPLTSDVKAYIQDLFSRAHMETQSQDVQRIVTDLTRQAPAAAPTEAPVESPLSSPSPAPSAPAAAAQAPAPTA